MMEGLVFASFLILLSVPLPLILRCQRSDSRSFGFRVEALFRGQ